MKMLVVIKIFEKKLKELKKFEKEEEGKKYFKSIEKKDYVFTPQNLKINNNDNKNIEGNIFLKKKLSTSSSNQLKIEKIKKELNFENIFGVYKFFYPEIENALKLKEKEDFFEKEKEVKKHKFKKK